jgi:glycosyltransferase involved in cell wall biosynthesis
MMKALADTGHAVSLLTVDPPPEPAVAGVPFVARYCLADNCPAVPTHGRFPLQLTKMQEKFRAYWGVPADRVRQVAAAAADCDADAVVVSGLNVLPYLGAVQGRARVWYAADEWVWHHLSMVHPFRRSTWGEIKPAVTKGLYQRAYRRLLDRVWVVTETDATAFRWLAGVRGIDVVPNGVDADHFRPGKETQLPNSCAFWGRLDFGPNLQALRWFCRKVWPALRAKVPSARFRVFGFQPTPDITALNGRDGIEVTPDLPDLRPAVRGCQVAVLPFVSGGGIKNKLLEAAAMGLPVVASRRAVGGLGGRPPVVRADTVGDWVEAVARLWADPVARADAGASARIAAAGVTPVIRSVRAVDDTPVVRGWVRVGAAVDPQRSHEVSVGGGRPG